MENTPKKECRESYSQDNQWRDGIDLFFKEDQWFVHGILRISPPERKGKPIPHCSLWCFYEHMSQSTPFDILLKWLSLVIIITLKANVDKDFDVSLIW